MNGEMTVGQALAGRRLWLVAIGVGSFGLGELFARRPAAAIPSILLAALLFARLWAARGRCEPPSTRRPHASGFGETP